MNIDKNDIDVTLKNVKTHLLAARNGDGHWRGRLASSALATATAIGALTTVDRKKHQPLIKRGLNWLAANANFDGGFGDTTRDISNVPATVLAWAAFGMAQDTHRYQEAAAAAESWIKRHLGTVDPENIVKQITAIYGTDRTFSAPILMMCALAGRLGKGDSAWKLIDPLPFELAIFPQPLFRWLNLGVVSYALPALIAIGQVSYYVNPPANLYHRLIRRLARRKSLKVLKNIQPEHGGFLEATTLTSFTVIALGIIGRKKHHVAKKGIEFVIDSVRDDGAWPIDTDLATWLTTLSVNAFAEGGDLSENLPAEDRRKIRQWLLGQQYRTRHPYTYSPPGGWAWTDRPGGVPDADDTAGALIALYKLDSTDPEAIRAAGDGINWLIGLQNKDGGIPTFCRGRTQLQFDQSAPDLTIHAALAMNMWLGTLRASMKAKAQKSILRCLDYLARTQAEDGTWSPLWFGNQFTDGQKNPVYGTARVVIGLSGLSREFYSAETEMLNAAAGWLLSVQNEDGGFGGAGAVDSSIEETALALDALATLSSRMKRDPDLERHIKLSGEQIKNAIENAVAWLIETTGRGTEMTATPIGLYFAKLWYFEKLYPWIFTLAALQKARNLQDPAR